MSGRRTWDKDHYEQKAAWRAENEEYGREEEGAEVGPRSDKEEFKGAVEGTSGPMGSNRAFLSARATKISADKEVGKVKVVTAQQMEVGDGAGFYCEVCKCLLKDDRAYLNHVNGKNHQRALGFSMRVERAAVSSVKDKLKGLKRKKLGGAKTTHEHEKIGKYGDEQGKQQSNGEDKDSEKKDEATEKEEEEAPHKKLKLESEEVEPGPDEDDEMMKMMGFGGFK